MKPIVLIALVAAVGLQLGAAAYQPVENNMFEPIEPGRAKPLTDIDIVRMDVDWTSSVVHGDLANPRPLH